jgi:hypothetical protein
MNTSTAAPLATKTTRRPALKLVGSPTPRTSRRRVQELLRDLAVVLHATRAVKRRLKPAGSTATA